MSPLHDLIARVEKLLEVCREVRIAGAGDRVPVLGALYEQEKATGEALAAFKVAISVDGPNPHRLSFGAERAEAIDGATRVIQATLSGPNELFVLLMTTEDGKLAVSSNSMDLPRFVEWCSLCLNQGHVVRMGRHSEPGKVLS
jgi:hypothetical protein